MLKPSGGSSLILYFPGGRPAILNLPSAFVLASTCLFAPEIIILTSLTGGHPCSYGTVGRRSITSPDMVPPGAAFDSPLMYSRSSAASDSGRVREQILVESVFASLLWA